MSRGLWLLLASPLVVTVGLGCGGGQVADRGAGSEQALFRLELTGTSEGLKLEGAPLDPTYTAMYPNPDHVKDMVVEIFSDGVKKTLCSDAACEDSPFFVEIRELAGGQDLGVWDMYGKLVARQMAYVKDRGGSGVTSAGETERSGRTGGARQPGSSGEPGQMGNPGGDMSNWGWIPQELFGGGLPGGGSLPGGGGLPGGDVPGGGFPGLPGSGGTNSEQPPVCSGDLAKTICDEVNQRLRDRKIDYVLDCSLLNEQGAYSGVSATDLARPKLSHVPCHDLVPREWIGGGMTGGCSAIRLNTMLERVNQILMKDSVCLTSPLVLDLDGNGVRGSTLAEGVSFDLIGSGEPMQCAWPAGKNDAFLVRDRNGNGAVDDATELFGNATGGGLFSDGFAALATLDSNHDGVVDAADHGFSSLALWRDENRDGISQPDELTTLPKAGIVSLGLAPTRRFGKAADDGNGNAILLESLFVRSNGTRGTLVDLFLQTGAATTHTADKAPGSAVPRSPSGLMNHGRGLSATFWRFGQGLWR